MQETKLLHPGAPDGTYNKIKNNTRNRRIPEPKPERTFGEGVEEYGIPEEESRKSSSNRLQIKIIRVGGRGKGLDIDNFAGGCKHLIDALKKQGYIHDDDPESVDIIFQQKKTHPLITSRGMVVIIE